MTHMNHHTTYHNPPPSEQVHESSDPVCLPPLLPPHSIRYERQTQSLQTPTIYPHSKEPNTYIRTTIDTIHMKHRIPHHNPSSPKQRHESSDHVCLPPLLTLHSNRGGRQTQPL